MAGTEGVAERWRELSGEKNWEGLLDPLDIDLRRYIIHYGERSAAIGDAYNGEKVSNMCRFSRYPPNKFFSEVGLEFGNPFKYTVTSFFYARSEVNFFVMKEQESSWMGYVAVATDKGKAVLGRRDILICWRGTMNEMEWAKDIEIFLDSASDIFGDNPHRDAMVHKGFHSLYTAKSSISEYNKSSAREQILSEVRKLVDKYKDEEISITVAGHSLGAALATITGVDIASNGYNKPSILQEGKACPVTVMAFASPRVGNEGFKKAVSQIKDLHVLRIKNESDPVTTLPPEIFSYVDVGQQLVIDTTKSRYLLSPCVHPHDLEIYLHGVAGTQGKSGSFELVIHRCTSLVNKHTNALDPERTPNVPEYWWNTKNKNMVQKDDGSWELDDYVPPPPSPITHDIAMAHAGFITRGTKRPRRNNKEERPGEDNTQLPQQKVKKRAREANKHTRHHNHKRKQKQGETANNNTKGNKNSGTQSH